MSKYAPLRAFLEGRGTETVAMTFSEIEKVLGFKLPKSQIYPAWWSNNPTNNVMTSEWIAAGYRTEQVDIEGRKLVFRKVGAPVGEAKGDTDKQAQKSREPRRHPLFGWMRGMITIAPGTDLTEPADPDWGDIAWGAESDANTDQDRR